MCVPYSYLARPSGACYVFDSCPTAHAVGYLLTALPACRLRKCAEFRCQYLGNAHRRAVMTDVAIGERDEKPVSAMTFIPVRTLSAETNPSARARCRPGA